MKHCITEIQNEKEGFYLTSSLNDVGAVRTVKMGRSQLTQMKRLKAFHSNVNEKSNWLCYTSKENSSNEEDKCSQAITQESNEALKRGTCYYEQTKPNIYTDTSKVV